MQETNNTSKVSVLEWLIITAVAIIVDVIQIILNFIFGSGVIINRIISILFGGILVCYLTWRGVSLLSIKRLFGFTAALIVEEIPVLDFIPMWTADVIFTWWTTKSNIVSKVAGNFGKAGSITNPLQSLNSAGTRGPQLLPPLNQDGIRAPGGGLNSR